MYRKEENKAIGLNAQIVEELNKAIDDMTLFDDDLMSRVLTGIRRQRNCCSELFLKEMTLRFFGLRDR